MEFELKYQNAIRELKTYACCKENPGAPEVVTISKIVAWMCSGAHLEEELLCKAANRFSEPRGSHSVITRKIVDILLSHRVITRKIVDILLHSWGDLRTTRSQGRF